MNNEIEQINLTLPSNVKIFTFIGSRCSTEMRYLKNYFAQKESENSYNPVNFYFKWSSFLQTNTLNEIKDTIASNQEGKQVRFIIGLNLNDYNEFPIEEMNGLTNLITHSSKVFYFSFGEDYYFKFCVRERVQVYDFNEIIWPNYVEFSKLILDYLDETKLVLIDSLNTVQNIIKTIENNSPRVTTGVPISKLIHAISKKSQLKTSRYIESIIKDTKKDFRLGHMRDIEVELYDLVRRNTQNPPLILNYLIDVYQKRDFFSFSEKSVLKNVFVNGSEDSKNPTLLTILMENIIKLVDQDDQLQVVTSAIEVLKSLGNHIIFKHGVFNNELYVQLIYILLESKTKLLQYEATRLVTLMFSTDYKRYGHLLVEYDKKTCKSITLMLYNLLFDFYLKYSDENVKETTSNMDNKVLYDTLNTEAFDYCLKFGTSHQLSQNKIEDLFNLCVSNRFLPYKRAKTGLYSNLMILLKRSPNTILLDKKILSLMLHDVNRTLEYLYEHNFTKYHYWTRTTLFLKEILVFVQKNPRYETPEFDDDQQLKELVDSLRPEVINSLDAEQLGLINDENSSFLLSYVAQVCSSSDDWIMYSNFLYRSQHFWSKPTFVSVVKKFLKINSPNPKKCVKVLYLIGDLVKKEVLGVDEIELLLNEWFEQGYQKFGVGLKMILDDKFETKLFEQFDDSAFKNIDELFGLEKSLVERHHEVYLSLHKSKLDFKTEYVKSLEMTKLDIIELTAQNETLKINKKNLESELQKLKVELKRIEDDRQSKINELNELRARNLEPKQKEIVYVVEKNPEPVDLSGKIDLDLIDDETALNEIDVKITTDEGLPRQILDTLKYKRQTFKEFRSLIRGSLEHLSVNLYTSPYQFLSEIIQNFEDTEYDANEPYVKLIIDRDFLLFCNNEKGFRTKDIKSICSCSESLKKKGEHIGHKGLGFKSVFLCSDNPVIVSKKWKFEFRKEKDEISFITPHFLDKTPDGLQKYIAQDTTSNTFIYLPLKQSLKYTPGDVKSEKYFDDIQSNIDPNILLFTNKIKKLVIINQIKKTRAIIECVNPRGMSSQFGYKTQEKLLRLENTETRVQLYQKQIKIPEYLVESEKLSSNQTELSLGFPEVKKTGCKVFAFLPICDLNFNFFINASWILVTNRESINQNSSLNSYYREKLVEFFIDIIKTQPVLKQNLLEYIPKTSNIVLNDFWKQFVTDLNTGLRTIICENLQFDTKTYVFNPDLRPLLTNDFCKSYNLKLADPEETGIDYESLGFTRITLSIILDHLSLDECQSLDDQWWINFYRLLDLNFNDEIKQKCSGSNIFLISGKRTRKTDRHFLIDDQKEFFSWRNELVLIDYNSSIERNFISNCLEVPKITKEFYKDFIVNLHLDNRDLGPHSLIWKDLTFIKRYFPNDVFVLYVPTRCGRLRPIHECNLSQIIGYDLQNLTSSQNLIDFGSKGIDWEVFFIRQKCQFPELDREENKIDQLFTGFSTFTSQDLVYVKQILDLITGLKIKDFLLRLPVKSKYLDDENYVTFLCMTCVRQIYNGCLPSIDIPNEMFDVAESLGVSIKLNFSKCVKVLRTLVDNKISNSSVYGDWFWNLKLNYETRNGRDTLPDVEMIILEDERAYKLSDLYCCDSTPGLKLICKYLNKALVNSEMNSSFRPIETILVLFGAKVKPTFDDCLRCLIKMVDDSELFNNRSKVNCLSSYGFEDVYQVFYTLEVVLRAELGHGLKGEIASDYEEIDVNDLNRREKILSLVNSNMQLLEKKYGKINLPIVTFDNHMYSKNQCKSETLVVCFQNDILNHLEKNQCFLFLNQLIFKKCPYVMGLLRAEYLTQHISLFLAHTSENIEKINDHVNDIFREASGLNDIQVVKADYLGLRMKIKRDEDDGTAPDMVYNRIKYAIFDRKWILIACRDYSNNYLAFGLAHALKGLLKSLHPSKSDSELNQDVERHISRVSKSHVDRSFWKEWDMSCSKTTKFDLNQIIFAQDDLDSNVFTEVFFTSNQNSDNLKKYIEANYISDHECYMKRLELIEDDVNEETPEIPESSFLSLESFEVNTDKQKVTSIKAELFVCCKLKKIYGDHFNVYNDWVSSARNQVYPSMHRYYDNLGYDFKITDSVYKFSSGQGSNTESNICYLEVKGTNRAWDGKFHISKNEIDKKKEIDHMNESKVKNHRYVIVIVEWVSLPEKTRIAKIIKWTENQSLIRYSPESFLAVYNPDRSILNTNESNERPIQTQHSELNRASGYSGRSEINDRSNTIESSFDSQRNRQNRSNRPNNNYRERMEPPTANMSRAQEHTQSRSYRTNNNNVERGYSRNVIEADESSWRRDANRQNNYTGQNNQNQRGYSNRNQNDDGNHQTQIWRNRNNIY